KRAELQRRHRDAFAVAAHLAYAAILCTRSDSRELAQMLADDVVAGHLTHAVLVRVLANLRETEAASDALEIRIVGMRDRVSEIDFAVTAELYFRVLLDDAFAQPGKRDGKLKRRTRLGAFGEREFLVHHREDASGKRIDSDDGAVHVAQCFDGRGAHNRIFACGHVAGGDVVRKRAGVEALVITAMMRASLSAASLGAAVPHLADLCFGAGVLGDLGRGLCLLGRRDGAGRRGKISEREKEYEGGSEGAEA